MRAMRVWGLGCCGLGVQRPELHNWGSIRFKILKRFYSGVPGSGNLTPKILKYSSYVIVAGN